MVPFDRSHMSSEIKRYIDRKKDFIPLPFNLRDRLAPLRFFSKILKTNCPSLQAIRWSENIAEKFNALSRVDARLQRDNRRICDDIT